MKEWERLPGETLKAHDTFILYLKSGENRSIRNFHKESGTPLPSLYVWAKKWDWQTRALKYDNYLNMMNRLNEEEIENNDTDSGLIAGIKETIWNLIKAINNVIDSSKNDLVNLDLKQIIDYAGKISKVLPELYQFYDELDKRTDYKNSGYDKKIIEKINFDPELQEIADNLLAKLAGD